MSRLSPRFLRPQLVRLAGPLHSGPHLKRGGLRDRHVGTPAGGTAARGLGLVHVPVIPV